MAHDEETADRFRQAIDGVAGVSETRMMGGLVFLLNGNMLGGAHREKTGDRLFMFRVGKEQEQEALARPHVRPVQFGDRRPLSGLVFVDADATDTESLRAWVDLALSYVSAMPAKSATAKSLSPRQRSR
jgi:TfoX/Sxy family transcriptional regulator of competence genes